VTECIGPEINIDLYNCRSDHVTLAFENECKVRVLEDIDPEKAKNVLVGISRIWVEPSFQRKGIATRMVRLTQLFRTVCLGIHSPSSNLLLSITKNASKIAHF
jgi:GNAT superfamily N-acetyltransferase